MLRRHLHLPRTAAYPAQAAYPKHHDAKIPTSTPMSPVQTSESRLPFLTSPNHRGTPLRAPLPTPHLATVFAQPSKPSCLAVHITSSCVAPCNRLARATPFIVPHSNHRRCALAHLSQPKCTRHCRAMLVLTIRRTVCPLNCRDKIRRRAACTPRRHRAEALTSSLAGVLLRHVVVVVPRRTRRAASSPCRVRLHRAQAQPCYRAG